MLDAIISAISPTWGVKRAHARKVLRTYQGAEANRITNHKKPKNQSADQEMLGPFGADAARAWGRAFVRDNAYAWGIRDTIVSSVVGNGITAQSVVETPAGDDVESVNELRDRIFAQWCEACEVNGQYTFAEIQQIAMGEIVEAGEVLVRIIRTPGLNYRGIYRPVPLALELIEADRLALDRDSYALRVNRGDGNRIIRGVEVDDKGRPIAYWIYPDHPNSPYTKSTTPERIPAGQIRHLFRRDRIGQTRGITWFAPVMSWIRDLQVYVDNEIQASAVASCFGVAIKTETPIGALSAPEDEDTTDTNGNSLEYLEPAMVTRLRPGESIESINPGRPNSASEPWINLMLRGISVGTGLSYEVVARDYSKTTYSSSRTSQLEDRRRFRRWQQMLVTNLCMPVWDAFCEAAALQGLAGFPTSAELLDDRRKHAAIEWQPQTWEWVDPQNEQQAATASIESGMSTLSYEVGLRGGNWRTNLYQRAKEKQLMRQLGLMTPEEMMLAMQQQTRQPQQSDQGNVQAAALNGAQVTSLVEVITQVGTGAMPGETAKAILQASFPDFAPELISAIVDPIAPGSIVVDGAPMPVTGEPQEVQAGTGEMAQLSTLQQKRNVKAINATLEQLAAKTLSETRARVLLSAYGLSQQSIDALIQDALDGIVDSPVQEGASATN